MYTFKYSKTTVIQTSTNMMFTFLDEKLRKTKTDFRRKILLHF